MLSSMFEKELHAYSLLTNTLTWANVGGLVCDLDSRKGITLNSGNVSTIADQSNNGFHATQTTAANQAQYFANGGVNDLPYIKFGTNATYYNWACNELNANGAFSFYVVMKAYDIAIGSTQIFLRSFFQNGGIDYKTIFGLNITTGKSDLTIISGANTVVRTFITNTDVNIHSVFVDTHTNVDYKRNNIAYTGSAFGDAFNTTTLGNIIGGATPTNGIIRAHFYRLLVYDRKINNIEHALIMNELNTLYS